MTITQAVKAFTGYAIKNGGWMDMDRIYLQNRTIAMIGMDVLGEEVPDKEAEDKTSVELMDILAAEAIRNGTIDDAQADKEILEAQLMDLLTPPPSVVNAFFAQHYAKDPKEATDYFFKLSKENDYIKTRAIAKNIEFPAETAYGQLEITINLSKPEKDPKQIAAALKAEKPNYPKCQLCMENEGYLGRSDHPARTNHRIIRMNLDGESWGFQYSPYAYYNEHSIILAEEHRPMVINQATFRRLLKIIEVLPHYFAGSNADLPIVGGSILTHDHYQAGRHEFPMAKAPVESAFDLPGFSAVKAGIVKWPMSVIRLSSGKMEDLVKAADFILQSWKEYSDESVSVVAKTPDGVPHHTITPIARKKGTDFELDLVLRDNNISQEFPEGIFHPHPDVQHIKKENIGLIEVMGLAILPPRLDNELKEVKKFWLNEENQIADYHLEWAEIIKEANQITQANVQEILEHEVGHVFLRVLEDAGVFKRSEAGQEAFMRFVRSLS